MPGKIGLAFFYNGTWSTQHDKADGQIEQLFHGIMYSPYNAINELYKYCLIPDKYIFDGPGTVLFSKTKHHHYPIYNYLLTMLGLMYGGLGVNNIFSNLDESKKIIMDKAAIFKEHSFEFFLFGWSRGAVTAWMLKNELLELHFQKKINIEHIHLFNIDPVVGGPLDRWDLRRRRDFHDTKIASVITYYSQYGNVDLFEGLIKGNLLFFSPLDVAGKKCLLAGNHQDVCGNSRDNINFKNYKKNVGDLILFLIAINAITKGLDFNKAWVKKITAQGITAFFYYFEQYRTITTSRKFLSTDNLWTCFFGKSAKQVNLKNPAEIADELYQEAQITKRLSKL